MKLKIEKGFYYGAGSVYAWTSDGYHQFGVGIDLDLLAQYPTLTIEVSGKEYTLDTDKALEFIEKYKSVKKMKGGTVIGVVSKTLLSEKIEA